MPDPTLISVLQRHFPTAKFDADDPQLAVGSFPEWDSLAHFSFLLLVEETYGLRFGLEEIGELKSLAAIRSALEQKVAG